VVIHQAPPTAKGFHFITLEDEDGMMNIIVRPAIYARYRRVLHSARLLLVDGVVEQANGVTNVMAVGCYPFR
jgi:error-prone DNA polymerase